MDVASKAARTRVHFPLAAIDPAQLEQLLEQMFQAQNPAAKALADATNLALGLEDERVELSLDNGERARLMVVDHGQVEIYEVRPEGMGTTFQLRRSTGSKLATLATNSPEYMAVVRRFRYSPLEISINGQSPPREVGWGAPPKKDGPKFFVRAGFFKSHRLCVEHHAVEVRYYSEDEAGNGLGLLPSTATALARLGPPSSGQLDRCQLAVGLTIDPAQPSTIAWVYCGETLQTFPVELPAPGLQLLVSASDLNLDLTGEKLVQDAAFQSRWDFAKTRARELVGALGRAYPDVRERNLAKQAFLDEQARWRPFLEAEFQGFLSDSG